jgi:hypothetical protein
LQAAVVAEVLFQSCFQEVERTLKVAGLRDGLIGEHVAEGAAARL